MGAVIPAKILGLEGQVIKDVMFNEESGRVRVICARDQRRRPVDHRTGRRGAVNRLLRRTVLDVPLGGHPCEIEIEYAETFLSPGQVRVEALSFVSPKARVTKRFARRIAGMARHMPISTVARHTGLSWDSVKAIECAHLAETMPIPHPQTLENIRYLGVDEVARAKGQSYFTLVYDLSPRAGYGRILWVKEGRESAVLLEFLNALSQACADGIEAVALDMGPAYIAAVRESLPAAAIVFDRFHVMQMFSKVIRDCRRAEFKSAKTLGGSDQPVNDQGQPLAAVVESHYPQGNRPGATGLTAGAESAAGLALRAQGAVAAIVATPLHNRRDDCAPRRLVRHGQGSQDHRARFLREYLAVAPHRHLRLCRSSDYYLAPGGGQCLHRSVAPSRQRVPRHDVFQAQDIPVEYQGHALVPLSKYEYSISNPPPFIRRKPVNSPKKAGMSDSSTSMTSTQQGCLASAENSSRLASSNA
ncbi:MAG: transposase [Sulfurimicrobium sp.]|nr:transposase [Sulfurimicrobium sp.]